MSVASKNPFALLSEDGDAPVAAAPAKKAEPAAESRAARDVPGTANKRGGAGAGVGAPRGGARQIRGPAADAEANVAREARSADRGGRGRGRGRGGARRGREFDRHSQTGRTDSDKAIAQGWGGNDPSREQAAEEAAALDAVAEVSGAATPAEGDAPAATAAAAGAGAEADAAPAAPAEEVDNTKTLDEYLAEQAAKKAAINGSKASAPRKPEEWKEVGTKVEKASEEDVSYFAATTAAKEARQKARKEKETLEIDTYFEAPQRDTSERGGRGGARGGRGAPRGRGADRGRGAPRGGAAGGPGRGASAPRGGRGGQGANFSLDDSRAFPSLGA